MRDGSRQLKEGSGETIPTSPLLRHHYLWRQRQYATSFTNTFIYMFTPPKAHTCVRTARFSLKIYHIKQPLPNLPTFWQNFCRTVVLNQWQADADWWTIIYTDSMTKVTLQAEPWKFDSQKGPWSLLRSSPCLVSVARLTFCTMGIVANEGRRVKSDINM